MAQAAPAFGISPSEKRTLDLVTDHPMIPREHLALWLGVSEGRVSQVMHRLVNTWGLIEHLGKRGDIRYTLSADVPHLSAGGNLTPAPLHHAVTLDAEALGELLPRQTGELYEPLQPVAEVLREEFRVRALYPFTCDGSTHSARQVSRSGERMPGICCRPGPSSRSVQLLVLAGSARRSRHNRACSCRGTAPIIENLRYCHVRQQGDDSHEDGARHQGLPRYPRREAMTCAETGGESKDRPKKRTPA